MLARTLGMTVEELLDRITSRELTEWRALYEMEPWGESRSDVRSGIVASVIANCHRDPGRSPFTPSDFVLDYERDPDERARAAAMSTVEALKSMRKKDD